MDKILKRNLTIVFVILVATPVINWAPWIYGYYYGWEDQESFDLSCIVNQAIGLSARHKNWIKPSEETNIFNYDKKNLFKYKLSKKRKQTDWSKYSLSVMYKDYSNEEISQLFGLEIRGGRVKKDKIQKELCNSPYTCKLLNLRMDSYVIKYNLLPKIIKILERPCDYLLKPDEVKVENTFSKGDAEHMRNSMRCDDTWHIFPQRKFVLLDIVDKDKQEVTKVIVERKDLN